MDSRIFETKLADHKIFKDLKIEQNGKLRNLLELKDNVLYIWDYSENCLCCINLTHLEEHGDETPYQKLHLMTPPSFSVERVLSSNCGSRLCVWGSRGATVAELPSRWGRGGLFDSGNQTVLCKSHTLDERFLYCQSEVRRVHWHPTSFSHLLVLVSDNTIRLYNIALKNGPKLVKIYSIGPKPSSYLAGKTLLDSLGDTAVDFTAAPDSERLLLLRGNGDVYMMSCELEGPNGLQSKLTGPLAMYPPADDNYGSESCSIAVLGGGDVPPLIVVATCSAALYHCLLLPNASEKEDGDTHALYVLEAVELSPEPQESYPVHLYPCSNNTYLCVHAAGVHSVTLPLLSRLLDYILAGEDESEAGLWALCSKASVARHLVRTSRDSAHPPIGLAYSAPPLGRARVLCSDGRLLTRTLEPYDLEDQLYKELQLMNPAFEKDDLDGLLKERQKMSFTRIVQEILSRDVSQPILNLNKAKEPSPKETLEFLAQATLKLRSEYMSRQDRAGNAITRKLEAVSSVHRQQDTWLKQLQKEVDDTVLQSTVLQEKCMLAEKHQEDIKYRCSTVIRKLRASSALSGAEQSCGQELRNQAATTRQLQHRLLQLQQHARYRQAQMKEWQQDYKKKDIALGKSHSDTISSILQQQTSQISSLIEETKLLKDQLSIV